MIFYHQMTLMSSEFINCLRGNSLITRLSELFLSHFSTYQWKSPRLAFVFNLSWFLLFDLLLLKYCKKSRVLARVDIMWHEARKQEKKIRGLLVDYQRRAQRRKDYYEKIVSTVYRAPFDIIIVLSTHQCLLVFQKADPTQFLQLHGRQCKIHIDPGIAIAANSPATMWVSFDLFTNVHHFESAVFLFIIVLLLGCLGKGTKK